MREIKSIPSWGVALLSLWLVAFALPVCGQDPEAPPAEPEAIAQDQNEPAEDLSDPPDPPDSSDPEFDRSPDGFNKAETLFAQVVAAYRQAPVVRDTPTINVTTIVRGNSNTQTSTVEILVAEDAARLDLNGMMWTAVDGTFYAEWDEYPSRYFAEDFTGTIDHRMFEAPFSPLPHFALRYADDPLYHIFLNNLEPAIAAHRTIIGDDGVEYDEILIDDASGEGAAVTLRIDPKTFLVREFRALLRDAMMDEGDGTSIVVTMTPEILDEIPLGGVLVETEGREEVATLNDLMMGPQPADLIGEPLPSFSLIDGAGEEHEIDDYLGHVIVLVFWWRNSEILAPTLDAVQEVHEWVELEGKSVKLIAVNVGDDDETLDFHLEEHEYTFPIHRDQDGAIAFEKFHASALPLTVIVAGNGTIAMARMGIDPAKNVAEQLKSDIRKAINRGL